MKEYGLGTRVMVLERISLDKEDIGNQEFAINKLITEKGWVLVHEPFRLQEKGDVGQRWENGQLMEDRIELLELLRLGRLKKYDLLVVWHHDRLTRAGGTSLVNYIRQFDSVGIGIFDYQDNIVLDSGSSSFGEVKHNIDGYGAKLYKEEIIKKTKNALDRIKYELATSHFHVVKGTDRTITSLGRPKHMVGRKGTDSYKELTEGDIERIKSLHSNGNTVAGIAKEFGCSITPIRKILGIGKR
jgi:DNA invertase Pin-like site-specific DNA recombinase